MPGNKPVVELHNATSGCINYVSTMDGVFATGFNWQEIRELAGVLGIKFTAGTYGKMKYIEAAFLKHFNNKQTRQKGGKA